MFGTKSTIYFRPVKFLLTLFLPVFSVAQLTNDACPSATKLCPNLSVSGSTTGATGTLCPDCEDDFTFCFTGRNTVWYEFRTNVTGGTVNFNFSNLAFVNQVNRGNALDATLIQAALPCDAATYTQIGNCVLEANANFNLTAAGLPANTTYYIVVNGSRNGGATLPASATFDLVGSGSGFDRPAPAVSIYTPGTICPESLAYLSANLDNCQDTSSFQWFVNGIPAATTFTYEWQTSALNDGDLVTVNCSCFDVCPVNLTSFPLAMTEIIFSVNAGLDQNTTSGTEITLIGSSDGDSVRWFGQNPIFNATNLAATVVPQETESYFLTAYKNGCTLSDEVIVYVTDNLTIPGSFSPNGDGINDKWVIDGIEFYPNSLVWIYDRWGQEVASITSYNSIRAWNGTNKGKDLPDGVYFYSISFNDGKKQNPLKGSVSIIR